MHRDMTIPYDSFPFGLNPTEESKYMIDQTAIFTTFVPTGGDVQSPCAGIPLGAYSSLPYEVLYRQKEILLGREDWSFQPGDTICTIGLVFH